MISKKDKKIIIGFLIGAVAFILFYSFQSVYFSTVGRIKTEYAIKYNQTEKIQKTGFCVRDEIRKDGKKITSFFYENGSSFYVPIRSNCENVSKKGIVALSFSDEASAQNYTKRIELKEQIELTENLKSQGQIEYADVSKLNSLTYSALIKYADNLKIGDIHSSEKQKNDIVSRVTSRQIATGEKIDFDGKISALRKEYKELSVLSSSYTEVKSYFSGSFCGEIDGFEEAVSYSDVKNKKLKSDSAEKALKSSEKNFGNVYGKIISDYEWYFIFSANEKEISSLYNGKTVEVSFPNLNISDIKMKVHDVSEPKNSVVTVTLYCDIMNEDLITLRKEEAEIIIADYDGYKISKDAIKYNDEGIPGVFVFEGRKVKFSPIDIKYYGDSFVIAGNYYIYKTVLDEDGKEKIEIDSDKMSEIRQLQNYDKVIVKGKNLEDGKLVN